MVEETLVRGMVRLLALDIKKLQKAVPEQIFWDMYCLWKNRGKGFLVKKWKGHEEEYSLEVVDELVRLCKISWPAFCSMTVSELAEHCERSKKLQPHKMQRAA